MESDKNIPVLKRDFLVLDMIAKNLSNLEIMRELYIYTYCNSLLKEVIIMIGDVLKRTRAIYGYTATEMSSLLTISKSYLSEIENNKKQPSLDLLRKYSEIYGIKLSSLILLSEKIEETDDKEDNGKKGDIFIKKLMIGLINGMSKGDE